jgi:hypothetical protein
LAVKKKNGAAEQRVHQQPNDLKHSTLFFELSIPHAVFPQHLHSFIVFVMMFDLLLLGCRGTF